MTKREIRLQQQAESIERSKNRYYPEVPIGVRVFDPRRLRRWEGKIRKAKRQRDRDVVKLEQQRQERARVMEQIQERVRKEQSLFGKVKRAAGKLGRFLGRGRVQ